MASSAAKKAPEYPGGYVIPTDRGSHMVRSRTVDGAWWLVRANVCSCPARIGRCFHVRQVEAFLEALEDKPAPRPLAVVKPSLFVD